MDWETKAHLGKLRHELDIGDDLRQCSTTFRIQDTVGRISQPIEGLLEPVILLESTWVVWIGLLHRVVGRGTVTRGTSVRAGPVLVGERHTDADTDGDECQETNETADDL